MPYCKLSWTSSSSLQKISTQSDWRRDDKISSTLSQNGKFNESNCGTFINVDKGIHIPYDTNLLSDDVRGNKFSKVISSISHKSTCSESGSRKCDVCGTSCYYKENLMHHKSIFSKCQPHKCDDCGKSFACKKSFICHKSFALCRPHKCDICGQVFTHIDSLHTHTHTQINTY